MQLIQSCYKTCGLLGRRVDTGVGCMKKKLFKYLYFSVENFRQKLMGEKQIRNFHQSGRSIWEVDRENEFNGWMFSYDREPWNSGSGA